MSTKTDNGIVQDSLDAAINYWAETGDAGGAREIADAEIAKLEKLGFDAEAASVARKFSKIVKAW